MLNIMIDRWPFINTKKKSVHMNYYNCVFRVNWYYNPYFSQCLTEGKSGNGHETKWKEDAATRGTKKRPLGWRWWWWWCLVAAHLAGFPQRPSPDPRSPSPVPGPRSSRSPWSASSAFGFSCSKRVHFVSNNNWAQVVRHDSKTAKQQNSKRNSNAWIR